MAADDRGAANPPVPLANARNAVRADQIFLIAFALPKNLVVSTHNSGYLELSADYAW